MRLAHGHLDSAGFAGRTPFTRFVNCILRPNHSVIQRTQPELTQKAFADADALGYKRGMALLKYLEARRAEIEAQMKALKGELAEIRVAEAALTGNAPLTRAVMSGSQGGAIVREGSIKSWVLKALALAPDGSDTEGIITSVFEIGGPMVPRNSMTPQLSRLKADGLLVLEGRNWHLVPQGSAQKEETPSVQPLGASDQEGGDNFDNLLGVTPPQAVAGE